MSPDRRKEIAMEAVCYFGKAREKYIQRFTLDPEEIKKVLWLANRYEDEGW